MADHSVILIVDDSDNDILMVRRALQKGRILNPLIAVRSGEEAVQYLAGEGNYRNREEYPLPELVLLDLKMTGLDGFDVLKWIREQPALKGLRVVVLTSSDRVYDVNQAYALGANSFLVKPSGFENFSELIQSMSGYWLWTSKAPELNRPPKQMPSGKR